MGFAGTAVSKGIDFGVDHKIPPVIAVQGFLFG
jgi:hypothetical protein